MRLLLSLVILLGVTYGITLVAQTMTRQNLEVPSELLGVYVAPIYVAIPDVIQPDVFPFTAAGKQAFDDYDVFLQADNQEDDCVMESMPSVLFTGDPMEISHENWDNLLLFRHQSLISNNHQLYYQVMQYPGLLF